MAHSSIRVEVQLQAIFDSHRLNELTEELKSLLRNTRTLSVVKLNNKPYLSYKRRNKEILHRIRVLLKLYLSL